MDLKTMYISVILFLGLWKSFSCQNCSILIESDVLARGGHFGQRKPCIVNANCEETSILANPYRKRNIRMYITYCSSLQGNVRFSNICQHDPKPTLTCSQCTCGYNNESNGDRFVEFEVIDSACSSVPTFNGFQNVKVIRMHNTNLVDISITSYNLRELFSLDLSRNNISNINSLELYSSSKLKVLNVSYNIVNSINDQVFRHIPSLTKLDLISNMIENITSKTFYGLHNLNILYLSHNKISDINSAFENLIELEELYLNDNNLHEIKENYFRGLQKLKILKLNFNSIVEIDWTALKHIPMLEFFNVSHNAIEKVIQPAFAKTKFFNVVDLSFNNITRLVPNLFLEKNITFFAINNNKLEGDLEFGMFNGLKAVRELDLSHQHIDAVVGQAFYGLTGLSTLLLNDNKIKNITKIAFDSLTGLELLDLSNNMLQVIDFNKNKFNKLKKLQLKNNLIANFGNIGEMPCLELLDLSQNNLTSLSNDTYSPIMSQLKVFNVSYNSLHNIQVNIFEKRLNGLWIDFSFNSDLSTAFNLTNYNPIIDHPDQSQTSEFNRVSFSHCDMDNVFFFKLDVFKAIRFLLFDYNKIHKIEYGMFSNIKELISLDLSYNQISHIQPGSFKENNKLRKLNLTHNKLLELEYGSFRGMNQLLILDISFNKIESLKHGKFYETSKLNTLIADNNNIESVEYEDFVGANLTTLSIGGNPIPCLFLINLKRETHSLQLTALKAELHLSNFLGVTCNQDGYKNEKILNSSTNTANNNMLLERRVVLLEDIRNILLEMKKTNNSEASDTDGKSIVMENQVSNLTESIDRVFYKIGEANDKLIDGIVDLINNLKQAQANAYDALLSQNIIQRLNKSDDTNSRLIQLIADMVQNNNSKLSQAFANMSTLAQNIIKTLKRSDDNNNKIIELNSNLNQAYVDMSLITENIIKTANRSNDINKSIQLLAEIEQNSKKSNDILNYFKNKIVSIPHRPSDISQEINANNDGKHVHENNNNNSQGSQRVDGAETKMHFDKLQYNLYELMQNQLKSSLSEIRLCLMLITVVMFCSILYKMYELNLFSLLRRRRSTASLQINESIATDTL